jgi:rhodanese-related sulfurtransferase
MTTQDEKNAYVVEGIVHVDNVQLQQIIDDPSDHTLLIDVRESEEYDERHIPGIPLIPMSEIMDFIDQFDKQREYVLVCRSGRRSLEVAKYFRANGIANTKNFAGGMISWTGAVANGLERVAKTGKPDELEKW